MDHLESDFLKNKNKVPVSAEKAPSDHEKAKKSSFSAAHTGSDLPGTEEVKKKAATAAVALFTGASLLVGGLFQSPAELIQEDMKTKTVSPPAYEMMIPDLPDDGGGGGDGEDEELLSEEKRRSGVKSGMKEWVLRQPYAVRLFFFIPLWAFGCILLTGFAALWNALLSPVLGTVVTWVCAAAVILAIVFFSVKAVFPNIPVKKILNKRTVPSVIIGVAVIAIADAVLPLAIENYDAVRNALRIAATALLSVGIVLPTLIKNKKELTGKMA